MTDTLSREQVEQHQKRIAKWYRCTWGPYNVAPIIEAADELARGALAAMDERDAQVKMLAVIQSSAMAQGAATCASMDARIAQLEGENAKLREVLSRAVDGYANKPYAEGKEQIETALSDAQEVLASTALLSSPGRAPETRDVLKFSVASAARASLETRDDADPQAPLKWDVIAGIKAGIPIDDLTLQRLCNMAQDRACQLEGSYPNHRTAQSRAREAATRTEEGHEDEWSVMRLAGEVCRMVDEHLIDARSTAADALLDYASALYGDNDPLGEVRRAFDALPEKLRRSHVSVSPARAPDVTEEDVANAVFQYNSTLTMPVAVAMRRVLESFATRLVGHGGTPTPTKIPWPQGPVSAEQAADAVYPGPLHDKEKP